MAAAPGGGGGPRKFTSNYNTRSSLRNLESSQLPQNIMSQIGNYFPAIWWEDILRRNDVLGYTYDRFMGSRLQTMPQPLEYSITNPEVLEAYLAYLHSEKFNEIHGASANSARQRLLNDLLKKTLHKSTLEQFQRIIDLGAVADADMLGNILQMHMVDKLAYLLSKGLDPNTEVSTYTHETLLTRAIYNLSNYNYFKAVELLLKAGASGARIQTDFPTRKPPANADVYAQNRYIREVRAVLVILFLLLVKEDAISDADYEALSGKISKVKMHEAIALLMQLIENGKITPARLGERFIKLVTDSLEPEDSAAVLERLVRASSFNARKHVLQKYSLSRAKGGKRRRRHITRKR